MRNSSRAQVISHDVGTLWTMRRGASTARCALIKCADGWEARLLVENEILLSEPCDRVEEAFFLATQWQPRMQAEGWRQVVRSP
jgi:hypothetical protein